MNAYVINESVYYDTKTLSSNTNIYMVLLKLDFDNFVRLFITLNVFLISFSITTQ